MRHLRPRGFCTQDASARRHRHGCSVGTGHSDQVGGCLAPHPLADCCINQVLNPIPRSTAGTAPSAAEKARNLLIRRHTDPTFNATWGAYWATMPGPEEVFVAELFTEAHLELLQHPVLVRMQASSTHHALRQRAPLPPRLCMCRRC